MTISSDLKVIYMNYARKTLFSNVFLINYMPPRQILVAVQHQQAYAYSIFYVHPSEG